jgi:DNA-3-methyladenine glycosylase
MEPSLPRPSDLLSRSFFDRDPRVVARELLGCAVLARKGGVTAGGLIVETEAYLGAEDAGSHAATKGMTARNAVMYGPPGHAYVYFTYGNHHLLNFVCEPEGTAGAVLVRALEPVWGVAAMTARRAGRPLVELTNGPGKLTAALGVDLEDNARPLNTMAIFVYGATSDPGTIGVSGRIGLADGHEHEYRYYLEGNPFVSRGRTGPVRGRRSAQDRSES